METSSGRSILLLVLHVCAVWLACCSRCHFLPRESGVSLVGHGQGCDVFSPGLEAMVPMFRKYPATALLYLCFWSPATKPLKEQEHSVFAWSDKQFFNLQLSIFQVMCEMASSVTPALFLECSHPWGCAEQGRLSTSVGEM